MDKNTFSGPTVFALVIGLVVGFALGVVWQNASSDTTVADMNETQDATTTDNMNTGDESTAGTQGTADTTGTTDTNRTTNGNGSVSVSDQSAGNTATVERVEVTEPTWVAIREDHNGELGNILGAKLFGAGEHTDVSIKLLRGTEAGETYHAVLFADDGDHDFDHTADTMVTRDSEIIRDTFMTSEQ